jgi:hypothetical protein
MFKKIILFLCLVSASTSMSAVNIDNDIDFSKIPQDQHPRLMMHAGSFGKLKEKLAVSPTFALLHDSMIEALQKEMKSGNVLKYEFDASGRRLLQVSRRALYRITHSAYAYKMTSDRKYLSYVEDQLNAVCGFPNWNEAHYLDVAEMALGVSVAYDWLYDELAPEVKAKAEKALYEYAFRTAIDGKYNHNFYKMTNNWNQVCNAGLVAASLALYEKYPKEAQVLVTKAVESNRKPMELMYSPDGNYVEGYNYWGYGTTFQVILLKMLEQNFGTDFGLSEIPGFMRTGDFMLFMEGIDGSFNHSDAAKGSAAEPAMWYFAEKLKKPYLLYNEVASIKKGLYKGYDAMRVLTLLFTFLENVDLENVSKPDENIWYGGGANPVLLVRNDWTSTDSDAYLAVKGGKANNSHGHMDAGSFVYEAYGQRWAHDLGMQNYARVEKKFKETGGSLWDFKQDSRRWTLLRYNNYHHNTITLNDALHEVGGMATFKEIIQNKKERGVVMDMSEVFAPHARSVERSVKILKNNNLVVVDKVAAKDGASVKYSWRMVTDAVPDVKNNFILLEKKGVLMKLKASSDLEVKYCTWSTEPKEVYDDPNKNMIVVGFEAVVPEGDEASFEVTLSHQ